MADSNTRDYTLGFGTANLGALALALPICTVYVLLYGFMYGWNAPVTDFQPVLEKPLLLLLLFAAGVAAHEAIHAVSWSWLGKIPWKHIHFGFKWSTITPYVHCSVPVPARHYRWGTALPGLLLGIIPFLGSLLFQNGWLLGFGLLFTLAAGGDFLILWLLRGVEPGAPVQDHPERIGCRVLQT